MAEGSNPQQAGISITRAFDAPRERVWREWTEPERFADWFGGTDSEVPLSTVSMHVTAGGAWRATMFSGPDRRGERVDGRKRAEQGWSSFFDRVEERLAKGR
jgi:uncharacterized protein YndB with AHSA1/START domain